MSINYRKDLFWRVIGVNVWFGMVWYGMVWYGTVELNNLQPTHCERLAKPVAAVTTAGILNCCDFQLIPVLHMPMFLMQIEDDDDNMPMMTLNTLGERSVWDNFTSKRIENNKENENENETISRYICIYALRLK
ncbi:hypothetical protein GQX74_007843 [Glossina fuscipes]|nr:hypothetical protein GQX74_007843 [Glossina fuscipes]